MRTFRLLKFPVIFDLLAWTTALLLAGAILPGTQPATAAIFNVMNLNDSGAGSLRSAMSQAIATAGADQILFAAGLSGTIVLASALPVITGVNADGTEIRGETAFDAGPGPDITVDGAGLGFEGIVIGPNTQNCVVRGLRVIRCSNGFVVRGSAVTPTSGTALGGPNARHTNAAANNGNGVFVEGDQTATIIANMQSVGNTANGLMITGGAANVTVGGPGANEFNVFSDNGGHGVLITGTGAADLHDLRIEHSLIGLDRNGTGPLGNAGDGIRLTHAGPGSIHTITLAENTIADNGGSGITFDTNVHDVNVDGNRVGTNLIGTPPAIPNGLEGISIRSGATAILLRNPVDSGVGPNIVSGNTGNGVRIAGDGNIVDGCYIGVDVSGGIAMGNGQNGVLLAGAATHDHILRNVISGNHLNGVHCAEGTSYISVCFNWVGTDPTACCPIPNGSMARSGGILVGGQPGGDPIGGGPSVADTVRSNVVGAHQATDQFGIGVFGGSSVTQILTNFVGTDNTGLSFLPNRYGIWLWADTYANLLDGNLVSWSLSHGVRIDGHDNTIVRNSIGTDLAGLVDHPNAGSGIYVTGYQNVIGGYLHLGEGNRISGNFQWGIEAHNYSGSGFYSIGIRGNEIGVAADGDSLGNRFGGVWIGQGFRECQVGDYLGTVLPGDEANTIAFNGGGSHPGVPGAGVMVGESGAGTNDPNGVRILGNSIYQNADEGIEIDYFAPDYGNENITQPTVTAITHTEVDGDTNLPAAPTPLVQVFVDDADEGRVYLGDATVAGTSWAFLPATPLESGAHVTATNTADYSGATHTSEFSDDVVVPSGLPAPPFFFSELPDLGAGAIARAVAPISTPLTTTTELVIGGSAFDPVDGTEIAALWTCSAVGLADIIRLAPGRVNTVGVAADGGYVGAGSFDVGFVPRAGISFGAGPFLLPTAEQEAQGEVRGGSFFDVFFELVGWQEIQGIWRATVWSSSDQGQTWQWLELPGGAGRESTANDVVSDGTNAFAAGYITNPGGAEIPYLWKESDNWNGQALPLPAGALGGEVMHGGGSNFWWWVGSYRNANGLLRAAIWHSTDGGQTWSVRDGGSLPGDPQSLLRGAAVDPNASPHLEAVGASVAGDGSTRAVLVRGDLPALEVLALEPYWSDDWAVTTANAIIRAPLAVIVGEARPAPPRDDAAPSAYLAIELAPASTPPGDDLPGTSRPSRLSMAAEPNPFEIGTEIRFDLPALSHVRFSVHDVAGREIRRLVDEQRPAGRHVLTWDGRDGSGRPLPRGVYFVRLQAGNEAATSTIVHR